ncbi:MAG: type IV toxin-antitoxin system AbiEi family antitoxin domain-containing protein [Candidatus Dormibacteraceae bacterium]
MPRPMAKIISLAEDQWGLVTRRQAAQANVPGASFARLINRGLLERVAHGVYRVVGAAPADQLELRAAWLQLDPARSAWARLDDPTDAIVSHASAAGLYEVGEFRGDIHEFTWSRPHRTRRADIRIHRGHVPEGDRVVLKGLPATRPARMLADLMAEGQEPVLVARMAAEVIERGQDYPASIARQLAPFASTFGRALGDGVGVLEAVLDLADSRLDRRTVLAEAAR